MGHLVEEDKSSGWRWWMIWLKKMSHLVETHLWSTHPLVGAHRDACEFGDFQDMCQLRILIVCWNMFKDVRKSFTKLAEIVVAQIEGFEAQRCDIEKSRSYGHRRFSMLRKCNLSATSIEYTYRPSGISGLPYIVVKDEAQNPFRPQTRNLLRFGKVIL